MKKAALIGIVVFIGIVGLVRWLSDSSLRKAFLHHENYSQAKAWYSQAGGVDFVLSERWKNYKKYASNCPAIAEVVKVHIGITGEGRPTITLYGPNAGTKPDGFPQDTCSLWLSDSKGTVDVTDYTPY